MGDAIGYRQQLSMTFEAFELEITVNCDLSCAYLNGECQFHAKSHKLIDASLACPP